MSNQIIFSRGVRHFIGNGFVSHLDKIDEFNIGTVLVYNDKYPAWAFWKKKELNFTGAQLGDLLEDNIKAEFTFNTEKKILFDEVQINSKRNVDLDLDADAELKAAFLDLGGDIDGDAKKTINITVELGSINTISSNMYNAISSKTLALNPGHPIVREALHKGKSLFVIASVYQADKVEMNVSRAVDVKIGGELDHGDKKPDDGNEASSTSQQPGTGTATETTPKSGDEAATGTTPQSGDGATSTSTSSDKVEDGTKEITSIVPEASVKGDASAATTGIAIAKRDHPSNIGFSVLRFEIGRGNVLIPQAKIGVQYHSEIHVTFADGAFAHIETTTPSSGATASSDKPSEPAKNQDKPSDSKIEPPKPDQKTDSDDKPSSSEKDSASNDKPPSDSKPADTEHAVPKPENPDDKPSDSKPDTEPADNKPSTDDSKDAADDKSEPTNTNKDESTDDKKEE